MMQDLETAINFLFYYGKDGKQHVQVILGNETVWVTQKGMAEIFDTSRENITIHIGNIFREGELEENSVCKEILHTASDGKNYKTKFYNLDAIISVGYRVSSYKATQFRVWATRVLKEYLIKGFVLDDERLKQGNNLFGKDYFKELLERIREIRASERMFYEKVTDLFATSVDYDKNSPEAHKFFAAVQNKLEFAVTQHTSAELIKLRADATMPNMGLKTWKNVHREGKVQKSDVTIAKNYLNEKELKALNLLVNMFLDYAESQVERSKTPIRMTEWANKLDGFLSFNGYPVLDGAGKIRKDVADDYAEKEYAKFKVIQDRDYKSDFNKFIEQVRQHDLPTEEQALEEKKNLFDQQLKGLLNTPPPKKEKK